jgi:hypothetical protein
LIDAEDITAQETAWAWAEEEICQSESECLASLQNDWYIVPQYVHLSSSEVTWKSIFDSEVFGNWDVINGDSLHLGRRADVKMATPQVAKDLLEGMIKEWTEVCVVDTERWCGPDLKAITKVMENYLAECEIEDEYDDRLCILKDYPLILSPLQTYYDICQRQNGWCETAIASELPVNMVGQLYGLIPAPDYITSPEDPSGLDFNHNYYQPDFNFDPFFSAGFEGNTYVDLLFYDKTSNDYYSWTLDELINQFDSQENLLASLNEGTQTVKKVIAKHATENGEEEKIDYWQLMVLPWKIDSAINDGYPVFGFIQEDSSCPDDHEIIDGECQCPSDSHETSGGECIKCRGDQEFNNISQRCVCPSGKQENSLGVCIDNCVLGHVLINDLCQCLPGQSENNEGECISSLPEPVLEHQVTGENLFWNVKFHEHEYV